MWCEIRVRGQLDETWSAWFEGLSITLADATDTMLTGRVVDQAALHGVLLKVRDLGLPLLAVICSEVDPIAGGQLPDNGGPGRVRKRG